MKYGKQIGVIKYGNGINVRHYADAETKAGRVVVWRDGYATIHERN